MNLPSSCDTDEQKREAFSQLSYLREEFKSALIIGEMLECSTVSELSDWYGENKDILLLKQFDEDINILKTICQISAFFLL